MTPIAATTINPQIMAYSRTSPPVSSRNNRRNVAVNLHMRLSKKNEISKDLRPTGNDRCARVLDRSTPPISLAYFGLTTRDQSNFFRWTKAEDAIHESLSVRITAYPIAPAAKARWARIDSSC